MTRDPIGFAGGINLYGYCGMNPVGSADPSGLMDPITEALIEQELIEEGQLGVATDMAVAQAAAEAAEETAGSSGTQSRGVWPQKGDDLPSRFVEREPTPDPKRIPGDPRREFFDANTGECIIEEQHIPNIQKGDPGGWGWRNTPQGIRHFNPHYHYFPEGMDGPRFPGGGFAPGDPFPPGIC